MKMSVQLGDGMSDQESNEAASELTPEMESLVVALQGLGRGEVTRLHASGALVRMFLRDCPADHAEVEAALAVVAPAGRLEDRRNALYVALDCIVARRG